MQFHKTSQAENRFGCDSGELGWEWQGLRRNNVSFTVQRLLSVQPGLRHDPQPFSCDRPEHLYLSPSAALNALTEKQQEKET